MAAAYRAPTPADFAGPTEVLISVRPRPTGGDQIVAVWLNPDRPSGIQGQVFAVSAETFTAREAARGNTVRHWPAEG